MTMFEPWEPRDWARWLAAVERHHIAGATKYIRGHELPPFIVTFDGFTIPYGELEL